MFQRFFNGDKRPSDYAILVVDDDQAVRQTLVDILSEEGYQVITAIDGEQALLLLDSLEQKPDALVVDLMMPNMDGQEFISRARVRFGRTTLPPVILLTAARQGEETANLMEVDDFLPKPFDYDDLLRHIGILIEKRHAA